MATRRTEESFDLRNLDRFLQDGTLSQEEYQAFLDQLPDDSDAADYSNVQMAIHRRRRVETQSTEEEEN